MKRRKRPSSKDSENFLRIVARKSLLAFTEYMGYKNSDLHRDWYNFLQYRFSPLKTDPDKFKQALGLLPRGHSKTEMTAVNYASWMIGNHPEIHIGLVSKGATLATDTATAVITRIESDKKFKAVFGSLKPFKPRMWTKHAFTVRRTEISKNPTLKATGLFGQITGGRSDLIIADDIIDEENVASKLQIRKTSLWVNKILFPTLYPWGAIVFIGTRFHYADIYSELLKKWSSGCCMIRKAIIDEDKAIVLWPEYWSLKRLQERRKEIGEVIFNCQYQNDPTGLEGDLLKAEWLHTYEPAEIIPSEMVYYAGIDPALGEGDMMAIAIFGVNTRSGEIFLVDVWAEKTSMKNFLDQLNSFHATYSFQKIFVEANSFQKILIYLPQIKKLPCVPTYSSVNKERRLIPISAHFQAEKIKVNPVLLTLDSVFYVQWIQFPRGQNDDALDAVEICARNIIETAPVDAFKFGR
jgi:hypothetical protein